MDCRPFSYRLAIAVFVILVTSKTACSDRTVISSIGGSRDWFARLRALVDEEPCICEAVRRDGQLSFSGDSNWSSHADPSSKWRNYRTRFLKGLEFSFAAKYGGVVISSFNAHIHGSGGFYARFAFDKRAPFSDDWGAYYIETSHGLWATIDLVQMAPISCGQATSKVSVDLQTRSPAKWGVNGAGHTALVLPHPTFLDSVVASYTAVKSAQAPVEGLIHKVKVTSKRALLIMAANGRVQGDSGSTSLTYTVNGRSPTRRYGKEYGYYHVTSGATGRSFMHFGLYQLADVHGGTHTIQLEGKGSNFDLRYATSQVAVVPIDGIQLKTETGAWTTTVNINANRRILQTNIVAAEESVLALAATFVIGSRCNAARALVHFSIDGTELSSHWGSNAALGGFYYHFSTPGRDPSRPGSMLQFAKVSKGHHRVGLLISWAGYHCPLIFSRAAMQVGLITLSI